MAPIWDPRRSLLLRRSGEDATAAIVAGIVAAVLLVVGVVGHLIRDRVRRRRDAAETRRASKGKQRESDGAGGMLETAEETGRWQKRGEAADENSRTRDIGTAGKNGGGDETGKDGKRGLEGVLPALPKSRSSTGVKTREEKEHDAAAMEKKLG